MSESDGLDDHDGDHDDDHDVLVYEMAGWDADDREQLNLLLDSAGIAHQWDGDDLLVPDGEEDRVDALMDQVEFPEMLDAVDDDGQDDEDVYQVMSDLFVVTDRVAGASTVDVALAGEFAAAAGAAIAAPVPFGIDERSWDQIRQLASSIAQMVETEADDDVIVREAATLAAVLRRFV